VIFSRKSHGESLTAGFIYYVYLYKLTIYLRYYSNREWHTLENIYTDLSIPWQTK